MKCRHVVAATAAAILTVGGALLAAPTASAKGAPIIWNQSVARPSADATCPTTSDAEATAGWTTWSPSWAQWPNDGTGGYVCNRSITWAYAADTASGASVPSVGCLAYQGGSFSVDLQGGFSFPIGTQTWVGPNCGPTESVHSAYNAVYAPAPWAPLDLCKLAWPSSTTATFITDPDLYACA